MQTLEDTISFGTLMDLGSRQSNKDEESIDALHLGQDIQS